MQKGLTIEQLRQGISTGNRAILARAVTLIEIKATRHRAMAAELLACLGEPELPSIRIGITGVPGVGKSSFIEQFGLMLCEQGYEVAVLAIDPSSPRSRGSILGDKTRMEKLANHPGCFIRPSPSGGTLGGVASRTRETITLCESAGFNVILVETVGVGQSEATVREMVDFFLLLCLTGAGDELQTIKKGVIELADALVVTKVDGDNVIAGRRLKAEFRNVLRFLSESTPHWKTRSFTCSSITRKGLPEIWSEIQKFSSETKLTGVFEERRRNQKISWTNTLIRESLERQFYETPVVKKEYQHAVAQIVAGLTTPSAAVQSLLHTFFSQVENK